jgi:hypothetical protein
MTRLIEFTGGGPLDGKRTPDDGEERVGAHDGNMIYFYEREDAPPGSIDRHVLKLASVLRIGSERRYGPTGP